jgi:DNA mismatch repair ATPase MutS
MKEFSPKQLYQEQKRTFEEELAVLQKKQSLLGWLRLSVILLTGILAFYFFSHVIAIGWIVVFVGTAAFLIAVTADANNNKKINNLKTLIQINEDELQVLDENYAHRYDGAAFAPDVHSYANDLDIFGRSSLYQLINRCNTEQGRALLAQNLLQPLPLDEVQERHEAIKELAPLYVWRQQLQAYSSQTPVRFATQNKTTAWMEAKDEAFTHPAWKWIVPVYSVIAVGSLAATILGYIPGTIFSFIFLLYFIFSGTLSKKAMSAYTYLNGIVPEVETIHQLIQWIEKKEFKSALLKKLQQSVQSENENASVQIGKLKDILNRLDLRLNILVFIFLNSLLLWDVRQMMALNNWRKKNRATLEKWYELIAAFEVLNSLATVRFNHPDWTFPQFREQHFFFKGTNIGHPLIPVAQRVTSSFGMDGVAKIALVTGSNMAGKSTFLRSLGVNIVLAQAGAPVCATELELSPVHLLSSMRIADNLAENTSTFYAELKKLKTIIEAVNRREPVFILLDEILRGTNSLDRHTGSKALIRQLIQQKAVAVIATHDVELAKLGEDHPASIENYHFDVQVEGEELYFDYRLKHGVCTSLNASILMKKIGIEMSEE